MTTPRQTRSRTIPALVALGDLPAAAPAAPGRFLPPLLIALGIVVGAALVIITSVNAVGSAGAMRDAILLEAADNTAASVQSVLDEAHPALRLVASLLRADAACRPGEPLAADSPAWRTRGTLLRQVLLSYPRLDVLYLGDQWGGCTLAERLQSPARMRISFIRAEGTASTTVIHDVDANGTWGGIPSPALPPDPGGPAPYDARRRPWNEAALTAGGFTWTPPYVDPDGGIEISGVLPVVDAHARTWGVLGTDMMATSLSQQMRRSGPDTGLVPFLLAQDGTLVAAPDLEASLDPASSQPRPPLATESHNLLVAATAKAMGAEGRLPTPVDLQPRALDVTSQGRGYRCASYPWRVGPHVWTAVVIARSTWLVGVVETSTYVTMAVCAMALLGTTVLALRIRRMRAAIQAERELGSYRLVGLLGRGRLGEVWSARHHMLARPAALELIRPDSLEGAGALHGHKVFERFRDEARITATLQSPHTVVLYDFGISDDGTFYYVMELLDGLTLRDLVSRFGPLPPARVIPMLRGICLSLAEAHANALLHRHLGPSHVFACRLGSELDFIKVVDFGLVEETRAQDGEAADLQAVGRIGWWLLTGSESPAPGISSLPPGLRDALLACDAPDARAAREGAARMAERLEACEHPCPWTDEQSEAFWQQIPVRAASHDA